uniref:Uncharacterized protein n=1 Tax=Oryza sativa subsp. japonica TaxID=39947 RepID=Q6H5D6_ORYSJ|nr:hypothetical protein [Oryza sativa Japonica Group]
MATVAGVVDDGGRSPSSIRHSSGFLRGNREDFAKLVGGGSLRLGLNRRQRRRCRCCGARHEVRNMERERVSDDDGSTMNASSSFLAVDDEQEVERES